jgi:ssDNA-binding Zn-finger/Zn-ribbon topoisomerase 1
MEASKCPKCGEEPQYLEHVEKWYCYGCNSYVEDGAEEHVCDSDHSKDECVSALEKELKALDEEPGAVCKNCGAALQDLKDGKAYCFVCETYQDEAKPEPVKPAVNEAQTLLETAAPPEMPGPTIDTIAEAPVTKPEIVILEKVPSKEPEPPHEVPVPVKSCPICKQPLKYIEKYQRNYCYGCRKYAPKEGAPAEEARPVKPKCPDCGSELKFVEKYKEHYCYTCKKYPLRQSKKATEQVQAAQKPKENTCPKCGGQLHLIEKYNRHYCYKCKDYAPKGSGQAVPAKNKACPACKGNMKFIHEYNEWYCYKCKKYPLRPSRPLLL